MSRIRTNLMALSVVLLMACSAHAIVETIDATITAEVREYLGSGVVNSDSVVEQLGETTSNLPLIVEALLQQTSDVNTGAGAKTVFSDPTVSLSPDPNELGIAVMAASPDFETSYTGAASALETRNITFTSAEMGLSEGTPLTAVSYFSLDGALLIWSEQEMMDLMGTSARMSLQIEQRLADGTATTVLQIGLNLEGAASGDATFTASGALTVHNVIQIDISDLVPELGLVQLVLIPDIMIPYSYLATVDEPFTLQASLEGEIENHPGKGAAVLLGVPTEEITALIDDVTVNQGVGADFDQIISGLIATGIVPAKPLPDSDGMTKVTVDPIARGISFLPNNLCGILGVESAALTLLLAVMAMVARRSRSY